MLMSYLAYSLCKIKPKSLKSAVFFEFLKSRHHKIHQLPFGQNGVKMQDKKSKDSSENSKTASKEKLREKKRQAYIEKLLSKISPSGDKARERLQKTVSCGGSFALSWILSSGMFLFGSQPFALCLLCVTEHNLIPVFLGIAAAAIFGRVGLPVLWGGLAILIFRIIVSFVPDFHDKKRDAIKATTINLDGFFEDGELPLIEGEVSEKKGFKERFFLPAKAFAERFLGINTEQTSQSGSTQKHKYNESIAAKALFSSVGGFVCGLFALVDGDYAFFNMFGALCLILLSPIIVILFSGADCESVSFRSWRHTLSWFVILGIAVWSGGGATALGIPVAPFIVTLFVLFITSTRGVVSGVLSGLVFGLIYSPLYAPLLVLCALIYGLISPLRKSIALGLVCFGIVLWCYYFGGTAGLVGTLTPMLVSIPVFFIADKYYTVIFPERASTSADEVSKMFEQKARAGAGVYFAEAVSEREKNEGMTDKLGALSDAFSSLSETFNNLVDRFRRPDILGLQKISDDTFSNNCEGCRNRDVCWGVGYSETLEVINKITSCLHTRGGVEIADLPETFVASCPRAERIVSNVNQECRAATESLIQNQKIGVFASNFDDISAILRDALEDDGEEYECDLSLGEQIFELLTEAGYKIKGVVVCGKRNRRVLIKGNATQKTVSLSGGELCKKISDVVGVSLMGPIFEMSADETVMMFYSKPKLSAICSHGRLAADTDEDSLYAEILESDGVRFFKENSGEDAACGDCTKVFVNGNSYFYSLISDGMGSGSSAALASEVSSMFVEKMLMAGNRADITVRMLNNFLRSENIGLGRECSATLDLFELDLMNGCASFIKSGAAPTFICREQTVYKVNSRTMPVGIIKQADAKLTRFDTKPWDMVIMVSDGCCPDSEDCPWLVDYLSEINIPKNDSSPEFLEQFTGEVKNKILSLAIENTPEGRHKDDISVSVVLISA